MRIIPNMQKGDHNRSVLDTENVGRLLVILALPAFLGMFVQTLYNVVDTIFIGHLVGPLAIAGLSIVFPLQMLSWGIGMMVGMGGSSLISRFIGRRDNASAERTIGNGISIAIIMALIVTAVVLPLINFWLRLIGASDEVLPYARDYLTIIMSGTVFNVFAMTLLTFVRAEGNARAAMVAMMLGAILNIILDATFIILLNMGVRGAALATVISQITSLSYLLFYYASGNSYLKIRLRNLRPDFSILKQMFALGSASFVQTIGSSLSAMLLINMVVRYGGDIYLSAFGIIQRVMMFAIMPAMVTGQAVQPILGFNYGARRFGLALKALKIATMASTALSLTGFAVLYSIPGPIIKIFNTDPALVEAGIRASRLVFWSMPLMGLVMVGSTSFMSIGKAVPAFITALARPVLFLIPAVLVLPRLLGLSGVFLSFPTSDALTLLLTVLLIIPIIRQFRRAPTEIIETPAGTVHAAVLPDFPDGSRIDE
jgi:putative MATE family efflux protein